MIFSQCQRSVNSIDHLVSRVLKALVLVGFTACICLKSTTPVQGQSRSDSLPVLHLADQRVADARLIDITDRGLFTFQVVDAGAAAMRLVEPHEVLRWGRQRTSNGATLVWLADGSWLAGDLKWKSEQAFELDSDWFAPVEFSISQVRGLMFRPSASTRRFSALEKQMLQLSGSADAVWNKRSEQLSGVLKLKLRPGIEPDLPPTPEWHLRPTADADAIEFEADSIEAVAFSPILRRAVRPAANAVRLDLRDGSRLNVSALRRGANGRIVLTLSDNRVLETLDSSTQFVSAVARITAEPGRVIWLSALEPARYRFAGQSGELTWSLGRDQDLFGQPIALAGEMVTRAITMHAPSQAAYRWDGRAAKLLAEVSLYGTSDGLPTSVGSAECKVLVARQGKLEEVFRSPVLRASMPPLPIEVDVGGAQLVVLLVENADQGSVGDHILWREVRLVPALEGETPPK